MDIRRIEITDPKDSWFSQGDAEGVDQEQSIANARQFIVDAVRKWFPNATIEIVNGGEFDVYWEGADGEGWGFRPSRDSHEPGHVFDTVAHVFEGIWDQSDKWLVMEESRS